jgi:hypothetical protein
LWGWCGSLVLVGNSVDPEKVIGFDIGTSKEVYLNTKVTSE